MKKLMGAGFAMMMAASVLAGCGAPSSDKVANVPERYCIPDTKMSQMGIISGARLNPTDSLAKKVVLLMLESSEGTMVCTGTPIDRDLILTAAHCLQGINKVTAVFHTDIACTSGFSHDIKASSFTYNSAYGATDGGHDIGLVKLSAPIPADYQIVKIYDGLTPLSSDKVTLAGYGKTQEYKSDSGILRTSTKSYKGDIKISGGDIEISQSTGGICQGDSGGPVFLEVNGQLEVAGVNSYVSGWPENSRCHNKGVSMYLPMYMNWIKQTSPTLY